MEYMSIPQKREWTVNYSFPGGGLDTQGKHYNIGGVYSIPYSYPDIIRVVDYGAPYVDHHKKPGLISIYNGRYNRTLEAELFVIFADDYNHTLAMQCLADVLRNGKVSFVFNRIGPIKVYLGSPLSLGEYYYGNWNVTFRLYHNPNLSDIHLFPYDFLVFGFAMILAGISVITISLRRISRD
jgi:hypothetical protein